MNTYNKSGGKILLYKHEGHKMMIYIIVILLLFKFILEIIEYILGRLLNFFKFNT